MKPHDVAARRFVEVTLPTAVAVLVFAAGVIMLASAATPDFDERLRLVAALEPIAIVEGSHFVTSLIGAALLFMAFGLANRLQKAWLASLVLLALGSLGVLLRGFNYEEAIFLGAVASVLVASRNAFYRVDAFRGGSRIGLGASATILVTLVAVGWLAFFAYREVGYRDELWWTFVTQEGAPRVLRAMVGVAVLTIFLFVWSLAAPRNRIKHAGATAEDLERVAAVLVNAENASPDAYLAFVGDKRLLFSESGESFIQYSARGRNWVVLGEPVGRLAERRPMIWAFRDLCDRHGARPIFYNVSRESLSDFVDCGLTLSKIGENAIVDLTGFNLEGHFRAPLRHALNRAKRDRHTFEVLPAGASDSLADQLRDVSDAWLEKHQSVEKAFSLGRFDLDYLRRFPIAIARVDERIVAFANLTVTADSRTVAVDLMRYAPDASKAVMEALFTELLIWSRDQGYAHFDLRMAPLAGLENHRLARAVTQLGALIYAQGEKVYGFDGLRRFKNKFAPRWEPRYIAGPSGWLLATDLASVALLSGGGFRGLIRQ